MQKDTLREIIKEVLLEILEDDDFLLQPFLERARIDIVKSVSKDIERMMQKRSHMAPRGNPAYSPYQQPHQMYEDDGGDYDGGYGDDYDTFYDSVDGGYGYDDYGGGERYGVGLPKPPPPPPPPP